MRCAPEGVQVNLTKRMSITEAAESLQQFLQSHVPSGTTIDLSAKLAEVIARDALNATAYATEDGIDVDTPRQVYEAVGWLSVLVERALHDSPFEDFLLEQWAVEVFG